MRFLLPSLALLAAAGGASGQLETSIDVENRARLIGVLDLTRLSVEFDGVPARAAFRSIGAALGTTIVVHYAREGAPAPGIDPDTPVTLRVAESPARLVLEAVVEQCALYDACTWQLRSGYVEVGTKERLGYPGAAETRVYDLRDLMLEAPCFAAPLMFGIPFGGGGGGGGAPVVSFDDFDFEKHPYKCAALTRPAALVGSASGGFVARKEPEELIDEIAEGIVETIEPGNWDFGQDDVDDITGPWNTQAAGTGPKIARIRVHGDRLVITAPDYIHRQINGYPKPIAPAAPSDEALRERSAAASADGARVIVHGAAGRSAAPRGPGP